MQITSDVFVLNVVLTSLGHNQTEEVRRNGAALYFYSGCPRSECRPGRYRHWGSCFFSHVLQTGIMTVRLITV